MMLYFVKLTERLPTGISTLFIRRKGFIFGLRWVRVDMDLLLYVFI